MRSIAICIASLSAVRRRTLTRLFSTGAAHGKSRYPGLHLWSRNTGKRLSVKLPPGHLLIQAGKQLEHLSNGLVLAGFHEVVATEATLAAIEAARESRRDRPLIRISSTFFYHLSSDYQLRPTEFASQISPGDEAITAKVEECAASSGREYEEGMYVGDLVMEELRSISLSHA